jgi:hypothetical protein
MCGHGRVFSGVPFVVLQKPRGLNGQPLLFAREFDAFRNDLFTVFCCGPSSDPPKSSR